MYYSDHLHTVSLKLRYGIWQVSAPNLPDTIFCQILIFKIQSLEECEGTEEDRMIPLTEEKSSFNISLCTRISNYYLIAPISL